MKRTLKKTFAVILAAATILCCAPLSGIVGIDLPSLSAVFAPEAEAITGGACGENLYWSYEEDTYSVAISGSGEMFDYESKEETPWGNLTVKNIILFDGITHIGNYAFYNYGTHITRVEFPESLVSIGDYAFSKNAFTEVVIPDNIKSIGKSAFSGCSLITKITFGYYLESIDDFAFAECKAIKELKFGRKLNYIGENAFIKIESLETVIFNNSPAVISKGAFQNCEKLVNLDLGYSVKEIGENAFYECSALDNLTIPDSVKKITGNPFSGTAFYWKDENWESGKWARGALYCGNHLLQYNDFKNEYSDAVIREGTLTFCRLGSTIKSVVIPEGIRYIPDGAFQSCKSLESVVIPDSVTSIGSSAFSNCSNLKSVVISENSKLETIGDNAFATCIALTEINLPDSVKSIGDQVFYGCLNLKNISLGEGIERIGAEAFADCNYYINTDNWINNALYIGDCLIEVKNNSVNGTFVAKDGTRVIADSAFNYQNSMTALSLPDSLAVIGDGALKYYGHASNVDLGKNVKYIGAENLVPASVYNVHSDNQYYLSDEYGVLYNKDKTELISCGKIGVYSYTIPATVVTIYDKAFYGADVSEIYFEAGSQLETIGKDAFRNLEKVVLPDNGKLKVISEKAFSDCNFTEIVIPDCVQTIGYEAFTDCHNLSNIIFGRNLIRIGGSAFSYCENIETLNFNDNLATINGSAFQSCLNIAEINFAKNGQLKTIGGGAFYGQHPSVSPHFNYVLESVTIPDTVITIGESAFSFCRNMTYFNTGNGVYILKNDVFAKCDNLSEIVIGRNVSSIGDGLFINCNKLKSITVDAGNQSFRSVDGVLYKYNRNSKKITDLASYPAGREDEEYTVVDGVKYINAGSFNSSKYIKKVNLPETVVSIGSAFNGCSALAEINFPQSLTTIGGDAFNSTALKNVVLPNSVQKIGLRAFENCKYLGEVVLNNGLLEIDGAAFSGCTYLKEVVIPDSVNEIGSSAFKNCSNLKNLTIGSGVTVIGSHAFNNCTSIEEVFIPASVEKIGGYVFSECDKLKRIIVSDDNQYFVNDYIGALYNKDMTVLYQYPIGNAAVAYSISNGTKRINLDAFLNSELLINLTVPATLEAYSEGLLNFYHKNDYNEFNRIQVVYYMGSEDQWAELTNNRVFDVRVVFAEEDSYVTLTDTEHDVHYTYLENFYDGEVSFNIERIFDGSAFDVITTQLDVSRNEIYDITMTLDNVIIQPNGSVYIKIPVPENYDPERTFVYYIDNGQVKNMNAVYEDGYMCFYTNHFSNYALVELNDPCDHAYASLITTPATCTAEGVITFTCENCGNVYTENIPALGHNAGEWEVVTNSSCTVLGEKIKKCSVCGEIVETEEIAMTEHVAGDWEITVNAACTENGEKVKNCVNCATVLETVEIPAKGHTQGSWVISIEPSCIEEGEKIAHCTVCGIVVANEVVPAKGHTAGEIMTTIPATCTEKGEGTGSCVVCSEVLETVEIPATGHTAGAWITVLEPTTETEGEKVKKCTVCDIVLEESAIAKLPKEPVKDNAVVKSPSTSTISYGDSIILHVDESKIPEGGRVEWTASNNNFDWSANGATCTISPEKSGSTTFTATIYDANGNAVSTDEQTMTSKAGFFQKIIAFFKKLFGLSKTYPNVFKGIF